MLVTMSLPRIASNKSSLAAAPSLITSPASEEEVHDFEVKSEPEEADDTTVDKIVPNKTSNTRPDLENNPSGRQQNPQDEH